MSDTLTPDTLERFPSDMVVGGCSERGVDDAEEGDG